MPLRFWHFDSGHHLHGLPKVTWTVYTHYGRSTAFTEGLLIVDKQHHLELTPEGCEMRSRSSSGGWRRVQEEYFDMKDRGIHVAVDDTVDDDEAPVRDFRATRLPLSRLLLTKRSFGTSFQACSLREDMPFDIEVPMAFICGLYV